MNSNEDENADKSNTSDNIKKEVIYIKINNLKF